MLPTRPRRLHRCVEAGSGGGGAWGRRGLGEVGSGEAGAGGWGLVGGAWGGGAWICQIKKHIIVSVVNRHQLPKVWEPSFFSNVFLCTVMPGKGPMWGLCSYRGCYGAIDGPMELWRGLWSYREAYGAIDRGPMELKRGLWSYRGALWSYGGAYVVQRGWRGPGPGLGMVGGGGGRDWGGMMIS